MNETIQIFLNQILTLLSGLAVAYITFYVYKAKAKLDIEKDKLKDETARALLGNALDRINDLVLKGVSSAQQVIVADLKAQIAAGTASKEDLILIGKNVAKTVYNQLTEPTIAVLKLEINDIQQYITDTIETQILALKPTVITQVVKSIPTVESPVTTDKVVTTIVESATSPVVVNVNPIETTTTIPQSSDVSSEVSKAIEDINSRVTLGVL